MWIFLLLGLIIDSLMNRFLGYSFNLVYGAIYITIFLGLFVKLKKNK